MTHIQRAHHGRARSHHLAPVDDHLARRHRVHIRRQHVLVARVFRYVVLCVGCGMMG